MTQVFNENGKVIPATLVEAGPCLVTQLKTEEKDGYDAIQVGFEEKKKRIKKPQKDRPFRFLVEFKVNSADYKIGQEISVSQFEKGDKLKISGKSKGKGFQGVVKRHGFAGQDRTHGVKHDERRGGSIGSAYPQRVFKGKKMPGRMGNDRITITNLEVVDVISEENLIAVKGALSGRKGTLLEIRSI